MEAATLRTATHPPEEFKEHTGNVPTSFPTNLPTIDAEELHRAAVAAFRVGNRARLKYVRVLLALHVSQLYSKLGFSSVCQYAAKVFNYEHTLTYECLRVARALAELSKCVEAFREGKIRWSALVEITRVATQETEEAWLQFAQEHSLKRLKAEIKHAREKGADKPREKGAGLPALNTHLHFELSPVEHDLVSKAMKKAAAELSESLGGQAVDTKQVLVFWAKRQLATHPDGTVEARSEREDSMYNILYHVCPECRTASLPGPDGQVEIPREAVERVEDEAHKVTMYPEEERQPESARADSDRSEKQKQEQKLKQERDPPNNRTLVRKVLLRDGCVCANPHCRRRLELQAHHIVFRREGGATAAWNEVALCPICHSLVHMGYLQVEGDPLTGLRWKTRVDTIELDVKPEEEQLVRVPTVVTPRETVVDTTHDTVFAEKRHRSRQQFRTEQVRTEQVQKYGYLVQGLRQLGYDRTEARKGVEGALERLFGQLNREPTDEEILKEALRSPRIRSPRALTQKIGSALSSSRT